MTAGPTARDATLTDLGALDAIARMRRGELTVERYAQALLKQCASRASLNAFIALEPDKVREAARACDRTKAKTPPGPLFGLPVPVKDSFNTRDYPTTAGTPGLRGFRPGTDAPLVAKLRAAGALVLGKTNMHELAYGWTSNNAAFGPVRNPYDPTRIAGGSSGGTAAAVAARMAPLGVGEDTNGSIRVPAALCGVMGLRPTTGRYSTRGCVPLSPVLDQAGPLARSIGDLALFDSVAADDWAPLAPPPLRGLRLGIVRDYWYRDLDPEVGRITDAALARLRSAGVELIESRLPGLAGMHTRITYPVIAHDLRRAIPDYLHEFHAPLTLEQLIEEASPEIRDELRLVLPGGSDYVPDEAYAAIVQTQLPAFRRMVRDYFASSGVAALVFPATVVPALPIGPEGDVAIGTVKVSLFTALARNISPTSAAGVPGLVLPAGLTAAGLPVGLELDGPAGGDRALLGLGSRVAEILGPLPPPPTA
jgi:Asp-tRNA(Asn)/Glu-tRNA(Gln) amidotransferase A subunit family amidase